jgi:hypothetical protein
LPTASPVPKPPVAPAQSVAPVVVKTRPLPRPKVRPPGRRLEEEKVDVPSPAPEAEAQPRQKLVVELPCAATGHIRRAWSRTPSEENEEEEEGEEDDEQEEQEEEGSWSPPPVKRNSRSKAVPPPKPLKSTRKLVAVPTDALHDPPCGECDRREIDCVVNITGGACCLCRKNKSRCDYSKPKPKKPASRNLVPGPASGTTPPVPRKSSLRKTRCKFF